MLIRMTTHVERRVAMAAEPFHFAPEPAAGLDEAAARWLDETLVSLKQQVTIVMVSHDSSQVRRIADDITQLERAQA